MGRGQAVQTFAGSGRTAQVRSSTLDATDVPFYGLYVQSAATVISAAGIVAGIWWNSKIAKRRTTLDLLIQGQSTDTLIENRTKFVALRDQGNLVRFAEADKTNTPEAAVIRAALNRYELIALGVLTGALDKPTYKRWYRSTFVEDWIAVKPLVVALRRSNGHPTLYAEFQTLARAFANDEERPKVGHVSDQG